MSEAQTSVPAYAKHKVTTDALDTLGTIIDANQRRDAIHLAVIPVQAGEKLYRGDHIALDDDGKAVPPDKAGGKALGIVDPFLSNPVQPDEWIWMVIFPRVITSLRHVWTHPSIPDELGMGGDDAAAMVAAINNAKVQASRTWLAEWVTGQDLYGGVTIDHILDAVSSQGKRVIYKDDDDGDYYGVYFDGEYLHFSGTDAHGSIGEDFWHHVEIVLGRPVGRADETYFSCSC